MAIINDKTVMQYRAKHPNCLYCKYLAQDRYIMYYCRAKNKTFIFGNRVKARCCPIYVPRDDDLKIAVDAFKRADEMGVIKFDI